MSPIICYDNIGMMCRIQVQEIQMELGRGIFFFQLGPIKYQYTTHKFKFKYIKKNYLTITSDVSQ